MSTVREDLAAAASSITGITATPFYQQSTTAGHAFIRLERIDYPDRLGGLRRWNVVVILPSDAGAAEKYLEDKLPQLRAALAPVMTVTSVVPQQLQIPSIGTLPCVFINGSREEE